MTTLKIRALVRVRLVAAVCRRCPEQRGRLVRAFALLEQVSARSSAYHANRGINAAPSRPDLFVGAHAAGPSLARRTKQPRQRTHRNGSRPAGVVGHRALLRVDGTAP